MKKLLAILLAVVMAFGSFSMVSFAVEEVPAEKEGINATEVVEALIGLIKGEDADAKYSVGEVINVVISIAQGKGDVEVNVGEIVDTVLGSMKDDEEKTFEIKDILEIVQDIADGKGDFNGDGVLDVYDLIKLIEDKVSADSEQDDETAMIISIVFTVIKIVFKLIMKLFAA